MNIASGEFVDPVYGGYSDSDAVENTVNITGNSESPSLFYVFGGYSTSGKAINNVVNVSGGSVSGLSSGVYGGYSESSDATGNQVNFNLNHYTYLRGIRGGVSRYGNATGNIVTIDDVSNVDFVSGGSSAYGNATGNIVNINGGFIGAVYGGWANEGSASNNVVNITDGYIFRVSSWSISDTTGVIYGGHGSIATDNTINIYGSPNLTNARIYGGTVQYGYGVGAGVSSGNTLNIYTKDLTAENIGAFQNVNFYIPVGTVNGDTILTLTDSGGTYLSGVAIKAGVDANNTTLQNGNVVTLLTNANGLTTDANTTYGKLTEGVSVTYDLNLSQSGNSIIATIGNATLNPATRIIDQTPKAAIDTVISVIDNPILPPSFDSILPSSFDFEDDYGSVDAVPKNFDIGSKDTEKNDGKQKNSGGIDADENKDEEKAEEIADVPNPTPPGWEIFANMGGGSLRTKTGGGSYVDTKTANLDMGFARMIDNGGAGKFTIAPIIDYANGNYDSYLSDGTQVTHGSGKTRYIAGGGIFRKSWRNGLYLEGSFRIGKVKTDFASDDFNTANRITYDTKATAMAGHLKIGKNIRLSPNNLLDVYATYYHAHQGGMDVDLYPTGDKYRISSANSGRLKLGYRLTTRTSRISRVYAGLAYQYERTSGISATYLAKNLSTSSGRESGSSGMLEIGWLIKPLKNNPWALDINATGWVGHQRGVTAMAKVSKTF